MARSGPMCHGTVQVLHDDVIKWKHFPRHWLFVMGIHRWPVNSPHKGQWRRALMFSLIYASINGWSKQSWGWWIETQSHPLWRCCNDHHCCYSMSMILAFKPTVWIFSCMFIKSPTLDVLWIGRGMWWLWFSSSGECCVSCMDWKEQYPKANYISNVINPSGDLFTNMD